MKFLKTFLFTISFSFIFGSIMSLCGYCQALPSVTPDASSFQVIEGGMQSYSYFGSCPEMLPFYIDQIYTDIDNQLYASTGYDIEDYYNKAYDEVATRIDESGVNSTGTTGLTPQQAQWLANRFTQGTVTAGASLVANGYMFFNQLVPQFGRNAKSWFVGKYDDVNNKITDVCSNFVIKMTSEGLSNYSNSLDSLIDNGTVTNLDGCHAIKTKSIYISSYTTTQGTIIQSYLNFSSPRVLFSIPSSDSPNRYQVWVFVSEDEYNHMQLNGTFQRVSLGGTVANYNYVGLNGSDNLYIIVDGIKYYYCTMSLGYETVTCRFPFGTLDEGRSLLNSSPSSGVAYSYSSNTLNSIKLLLEQLVGKYVDNNSLNQINTIIREIPIVTETIDNVAVPVAEPSEQQLDDIETIIQEAIANSLNYEALLDPYEEVEPKPDPEPLPNNQGTEVPEDFPTIIFSPINDSVGSMFDFVSIFEPLFYIFSFSTGLLGLWLVVPFVILFLILFRLLK